jgi:hypothetical protein
MRNRAPRAVGAALAASLLVVWAGAPAQAQFIPYYGKNKVHYDTFAWRIYRSPHFEVFYYPSFEPHLARVVSYAESAYQHVSSALKHTLSSPVPLVLYKTHSQFEQTSLFPSFVPEGVAAFAEPSRSRMVLPIDEPPDRLYGLIVHELTHIFEFSLIPRGIGRAEVPLWIDEGLADYMRGLWDPLDLMMLRDAALSDQVPRLSRFSEAGQMNARVVYDLGHAGFEFIEAKYGKEGIRQFLYTLRKTQSGGMEAVLKESFRLSAAEFDEGFEKWLKARFKQYRDRQPASDYGRDLAPDGETTNLSQVYGFSPSPSGELVAALTGNLSDGEADVVLLSTRDGNVVRNLTKGYTDRYESISFNDRFTAGRSLAFDPDGNRVAFFARTGEGRSLLLVSVVTGKIERRIPVPLDQPQAPCLLPGGKRALLAGIRDGVSDIYALELDAGKVTNLTQDAFSDADPQVSPDGTLVTYTRRVSGYDKVMVFPLAEPGRKVQVTFGAHDDLAPTFSPDGRALFFASNEDGDIMNVRRLDLATGALFQYTDALGGNMAPALLKTHDSERIAFIAYHKGLFRLQVVDLAEPLKEVEQETEVAQAEPIDFQPDVAHTVLPENKRGKRLFEKFVLEGRPPVNIGVTSGGDFFGGSQILFSDVLGEKSLMISGMSEREYRNYDATFVNLSRRLQWGITGFDATIWGFADPYGYVTDPYSRDGALLTQRLTGAQVFAVYPLDKLRRIEVGAGLLHQTSGYADSEAGAFLAQQAALFGYPTYLSQGTIAPLSVSLVQETTRFHNFGPLSGSTFRLGAQYSPRMRGMLSRLTFDVDARKYFRLTSGTVFAVRVRGFRSTGPDPDSFFFGGNMELRGYDYRSFAGTSGFFANAELRLPLIDVMKTPIGLMGPVRGTLYAGTGAAAWKGLPFQFATRAAGYSYINDAVYGEPVSGFHLVDGRASFGAGLQFFFLGYPMHFDWTKLTDFKTVSKQTRFSFWIGYDF